jgi:Zn finger protein HypA/HybF involved in hydrogenase expression
VHEVSLVDELVELVERNAAGRPVELVRVRRASTIPEDVLLQAWAAITSETQLAQATLEVEPFDVLLTCPCGFDGVLGHDDLPGVSLAVCPSCGEISEIPPVPELEIVELVVRDG